MDIVTLFFVFLVVAVIGLIGAFINMATAMGGDRFQSLFVVHAICGVFWVIGGLGALITGIIWIVQQFS